MTENSEILRELKSIRDEQVKTNDHLSKLNGQVGRHEQWIAIRTDREQRSKVSGENRSSWFKVGISTIVLGGVAMIGLLIQIATSVH